MAQQEEPRIEKAQPERRHLDPKRVLAAIETLLVEKKTLTPDLGGTAKTQDIGEAILEILRR